jgi:hypothetical protein
MRNVLWYIEDSDIAMMTAFRKQKAHTSISIRVFQQFIQYEQTRLTPRFFKIYWHAFVITDGQIYRVQHFSGNRGPFTETQKKSSLEPMYGTERAEIL